MGEDIERRKPIPKRKFVTLPKKINRKMLRAKISEERDIGVYVIGPSGRGTIVLRDCKVNMESGDIEPTVFTLDIPVNAYENLTNAITAALNEWQEEGEGISGNRRDPEE